METMSGYLFVALVTVVLMLPLSWSAQVLRSRPERPSLAPTLPSPERPRLEIVSAVPRAEPALRWDAAKDAPRADLRGLAEYDSARHVNGAAE